MFATLTRAAGVFLTCPFEKIHVFVIFRAFWSIFGQYWSIFVHTYLLYGTAYTILVVSLWLPLISFLDALPSTTCNWPWTSVRRLCASSWATWQGLGWPGDAVSSYIGVSNKRRCLFGRSQATKLGCLAWWIHPKLVSNWHYRQ